MHQAHSNMAIYTLYSVDRCLGGTVDGHSQSVQLIRVCQGQVGNIMTCHPGPACGIQTALLQKPWRQKNRKLSVSDTSVPHTHMSQPRTTRHIVLI